MTTAPSCSISAHYSSSSAPPARGAHPRPHRTSDRRLADARNLAIDRDDTGKRFGFLVRDRDAKSTTTFDAVSAGLEVIRTPVWAPRGNAVAQPARSSPCPGRSESRASATARSVRGDGQQTQREHDDQRQGSDWPLQCLHHIFISHCLGWTSARCAVQGTQTLSGGRTFYKPLHNVGVHTMGYAGRPPSAMISSALPELADVNSSSVERGHPLSGVVVLVLVLGV